MEGEKGNSVRSDLLVITSRRKAMNRVCNNFQYGFFIPHPFLSSLPPLCMQIKDVIWCTLRLNERASYTRERGESLQRDTALRCTREMVCGQCSLRMQGGRQKTTLALFSFLIFFFSESVNLSGSFFKSSLPIACFLSVSKGNVSLFGGSLLNCRPPVLHSPS